jgi:leukotriene-A4 hydrolase
MENPNLIYVTPNIVIGDKSLVRVMLHEIAHSWSGNLVTNAEWQHFWLNEGLTVFLESRVLKRLYNEEFYALLMEDKVKELRTSIEDMLKVDKTYATLSPNYQSGADPDDGFSRIPYNKGMALFACMEARAKCTEQEFDAWLATYFKKFTNKSVQAWDLFAHYEARFGKGKVNWNKWLYKAEMPEYWPAYDTSFIAPIKAGAKGVNWTTGAYMVYLDHLYS